MNYYKISKISVFLITGTLFACSSNNEPSVKNLKTETQNDKISQTTSKTQTNSSGLKVFIDPETGEFQDAPSVGYETPQKNNNTIKKDQNANLNNQEEVKDNKIFVNPDGVIYKKPPKP
jgi:hypothetical protein